MTYSKQKQNIFQRLWKAITNAEPTKYDGSQRGVAQQIYGGTSTARKRQYDLEISECPIRDRERATILLEMREYCPEIAKAITTIKGDVVSSQDGDDQGVSITGKKDENGNEEPLDPAVEEVATTVLKRCFGHDEIEVVVDKFLTNGDCFGNLSIDLASKQVNGVMLLPTWEMFRVEDKGVLERFEQRRWVGQEPAEIQFHPIMIVHWRYSRNNLYGRALFDECREDWGRLMDGGNDLTSAARGVGVNPKIHSLGPNSTVEQATAYKQENEQKQAEGIQTDYYLWGGATVTGMPENNPDITSLVVNFEKWQKRIASHSGLPLYLFGLEAGGAKDLAGQPALAYSRLIGTIRRTVAQGIRQVIDTELALKGIPKEKWDYQLSWPKFVATIAQSNDETINDDTEAPDKEDEADDETETAKARLRRQLEGLAH